MDKKKETKWAKNLFALDYKGRYCVSCGIDGFDNPWIMDYHHRDPSTKLFTLGSKIGTQSFDSVKAELDKCDLLCCHCHRTLHAEKSLIDYREKMEDILNKLSELKKNDGIAKKEGLSKKYSKDIIESYIKEGHTIKDISIKLNEPYKACAALIYKYGLTTLEGKRPRIPKEKSIVRDYTNFNYSLDRIISKYNISEKEVSDILIAHDVIIKTPMSKKVLDVEKIKELLNSGVPKSKISKIIGCGEYSVYRVCKRHNL